MNIAKKALATLMVFVLCFGMMLFQSEPSYLHAAEEEAQDTNAKIEVQFLGEDGSSFKDDTIQIFENEKLSTRGSCSAGKFTMTIIPEQSSLLEFRLEGYHFEPSYLIVNEADTTLQESYPVTVRAGSVEEETMPKFTVSSNGKETLEFAHDETAVVALSSTKPLISEMYYNFKDSPDSDFVYEQPFEIKAQSEEAHDIELYAYYEQKFGDNTTKLSEQAAVTIHFKAKGEEVQPTPTPKPDETPTPDPETPTPKPDDDVTPDVPVTPSDGDQEDSSNTPTPEEQPKDDENKDENKDESKDETDQTFDFVDDQGNGYVKDQISLSIESIQETEEFQQKISTYSEFQSIPKEQIAYLEISLKADQVQVQPNGTYELTIPYPEGSTKEHLFVIYHFIHGNFDEAENLVYTVEDDGIHVNVESLSPFVIGWKEKGQEVTPPTDETVDESNDETADSSLLSPSEGTRNELLLRSNRNSVNTGDHTITLIWVILCLGSAGAILYGIWKHYVIKH